MSRSKKQRKQTTEHKPHLQASTHQKPYRSLIEAVAVSSIFVIAGSMLMASQSHKLKIAGVWTLFLAFLIAALTVALRLTSEFSTENEPQSSPSPPLAPTSVSPPPPIATTGNPSATPPPHETPSPTPTLRSLTLAPGGIMKKLREARDSFDGKRKLAELQKALSGLPIDWKLNFFSASRDDDRHTMRVSLLSDEHDLVVTKLSITGNEQLPLMERTDVFRLRGKISDADTLAIEVTDATLEYITSKKK